VTGSDSTLQAEGSETPNNSPRVPGDGSLRRLVADFDRLDETIHDAISRTSTPALDPLVAGLSRASDYQRLWLLGSAATALLGGRRGRRVAVRCLATAGLTSLSVDLLAKIAFPRARPRQTPDEHPMHVRRPTSSSFPSGHSASAFAFAATLSHEYPVLTMPATALATAVAYTRLHTGVHYPSDVIVGALLGTAIGSLVSVLTDSRASA
jgi:membrane-associated phospholipid phosphatase